MLALFFIHSFLSSFLSLPLHLRYTLAALSVTGCSSFLAEENELSLSHSYKGFPASVFIETHQSDLAFTSDGGCKSNLLFVNMTYN